MDELDLTNVNEIDMECNVDEDDDGFGSFQPNVSVDTISKIDSDDREIKKHTGVLLNFSDDDIEEEDSPVKTITVSDLEDIAKQKAEYAMQTGDFSGINEIDMECEIGEDDEDYYEPETIKKSVLDFGDDDEDAFEGELISEEIIKESKKKADAQINQGVVEDDYYDKLKKKHASTNVKGAYNLHFHLAGNPEEEVKLFNHDNTPIGPIPNAVTANAGDSQIGIEAPMGIGEAKENTPYRKLFEDILTITGFTLEPQQDKTIILKDKFDDNNSCVCRNVEDINNFLAPYVQDCFVTPLQVETGENFTNCADWVNWYHDDICKQYPQCEHDIKYCDVYANHLNECKLF